jgi:hypothetical protein
MSKIKKLPIHKHFSLARERGGLLQFHKFGADDYAEYEESYAHIEPVSDLSLNNVVVWLDINNDLRIARDENNVILRYTCPFLGNEEVFTLVGASDPEKTIEKLFHYQKTHSLPQKLVMTSPATIANIAPTKLRNVSVTEEIENFDYIYEVAEKANLNSPKMAKFRRTINRFIRDYGNDVTIKEIDLQRPEQAHHLINALHVWRSTNIVSNNDKLNIEGEALDRLMRHAPRLRPQCIGVYIGLELVGFSIYHYPPQKHYAIINHIKCNYAYDNIFDFLFFCVMSKLKEAGISYANGEQDLDIEGIRKYKHKLGPQRYIKRYTITELH